MKLSSQILSSSLADPESLLSHQMLRQHSVWYYDRPTAARVRGSRTASKKYLARRYTPWCNVAYGPADECADGYFSSSRRTIIRQLAKKGPTRFLDVAEPFDTALNAVTKHLKLLVPARKHRASQLSRA